MPALSTRTLTAGLAPEEHKDYLDVIDPIAEYLCTTQEHVLSQTSLASYVVSALLDDHPSGAHPALQRDGLSVGLTQRHAKLLHKLNEKIREASPVKFIHGMPCDRSEPSID